MGIASAVMGFVIISGALGWWSAALSFVFGILLLLLFKVIAPRNLYRAVAWSVVVLLAALIPVAQAIEQTGAASLIAEFVLHQLAQGHATWALVLMMVTTMFLSDLMNNAATAAIMSPIAIQTAQQLDASTDTFLMAVAVGSSCAFLTPIGHQNNTLILGPGGYRFGDYWRMGLPLQALILAVGIPMILYVWPLEGRGRRAHHSPCEPNSHPATKGIERISPLERAPHGDSNYGRSALMSAAMSTAQDQAGRLAELRKRIAE